MKDTDFELLARILGEIEAIFGLPLLRPRNPTGHGWALAYAKRGFSFAADRADAERMRVLTASGMLTASGQTQGRVFRITAKGVAAANAALGIDPAALASLYGRIREVVASDAATITDGGRRLCMVWDLTPSAGEWLANARRTETAWAAHLTERYKLLGPLSDLMALGLVTVMRDIHGHLWGAAPTGAVPEWPEWPDAPATGADPDACFSAWAVGFDNGLARAEKPPPADCRSDVELCLPATKWR